MRNLLVYPVETDEAKAVLKSLADDLNPDLVGDIRGVVIEYVTAFLSEHRRAFNEFCVTRERRAAEEWG